jgi:hypothetical protein
MEIRFYQAMFDCPLEEGDSFRNIRCDTALCPHCGLRPLPYRADSVVEDDMSGYVHLQTPDPTPFACLEGAGLLVATRAFSNQMLQAGLTGFELRDAMVTTGNPCGPQRALGDYVWVVVTGRCRTNDVWNRVVSICPECGSARHESLPRTTRTVWLLPPEPTTDLSRAREASVGIIASDRFRRLVESSNASRSLSFRELEIRAEDSG